MCPKSIFFGLKVSVYRYFGPAYILFGHTNPWDKTPPLRLLTKEPRRQTTMIFGFGSDHALMTTGPLTSYCYASNGLESKLTLLGSIVVSPFLGLPYRILNINPQKELLWSLWVFLLGSTALTGIESLGGRSARHQL